MREMGNLDDALWIANPEYRAGGVSLFIRAFSVEEKPVRATLTITGLGWFASYLNGVRTDDEYFKPLLSDYGERSFEDVRFYRPKGGIKRVYYHAFDVAHLLRAGENRLSVAVAAGWYDHREKPVILFLDKRIVIFFKRLGHSVSGRWPPEHSARPASRRWT